jgi:hypothetical protein
MNQLKKYIFNDQMHSWVHSTLWGEDEWDDETVKGEGFSENQDQDHSDKDFILLSVGSDTCVTHDTNG